MNFEEFLTIRDPQASGFECTMTQSKGRMSDLHRTAERGDVEQIKGLLDALGSEERCHLSSSVEESGKLLFHFAAQGGHVDALELLRTSNRHVDIQIRKGSLSALHLAAAYGHTKIVQWLFSNHRLDVNLQDQEGHTPLHLAVTLGHIEVVRQLVIKGANLYILDNEEMMPISFCKDQAMFNTLFSTCNAGSASFNKSRPIKQASLTLDAAKRGVLHYAAQFASNSEVFAKLIAETDPEQIYDQDTTGDTFLHVAAKYGNMHVLQALKKLGPVRVDVTRLLSSGGRDPLYSPGMYALLYNHQNFFDKLLTMGKVEITLSCIIKGLIAELFDKPEVQENLASFASTLPTYLALYANKDCIFNFLLQGELLTLRQHDDVHKRTCLHWAVMHKRMDIVEKLCRHALPTPGIPDRDGKTAFQLAFDQKNHMLMEVLRSKRCFKEHEEKFEKDRERYVQALNAILVVAALIAGVTFAGWLQLPNGAEFGILGLKIFWVSNSTSFFSAVATMCVTTMSLVPTPCKYVGDIVNQLRAAIVIDAGLLAISIAAVIWAFAAAGFADLCDSHIFTYQAIMRSTVGVGGVLCLIFWLAFVLQVFRCNPPRSVWCATLHSIFPSLLSVRARLDDNSCHGYLVKSRKVLKELMDVDLVAYHANQHAPGLNTPPASSLTSLETMERLLGKLEVSDKDSFMVDTRQQRELKIAQKERKEAIVSRIARLFGTPNSAT